MPAISPVGSHSISGIIETSFAGHSQYPSFREAMVTCISALTRLEELALDFESPSLSPSGNADIRLHPHAHSSPLRILDFQCGE
jgi:hypothetical protein